MQAKLQLRDITMTFRTRRGDEVLAVDAMSLDVADREFISIVGPSGCGKSTVLRVIAGLVRPTSGEVLLDGRQITGPGADRGMVFQSYTLFPWLTVQGNVEYGPKLKGLPAAERSELTQEYIELVGLKGFERSYPKELSGGMMQRVAIARALANDPEVLLMDEPFGALDAQTREVMHDLIQYVFHLEKSTIAADMTTDPQFIERKRLVLDSIKEESLKAINIESRPEEEYKSPAQHAPFNKPK